MRYALLTAILFATLNATASDPLLIARRVADRVVDNSKFGFEYTLQLPYPDAQVIDFGRSCLPSKGVAYALSTINSACDQQEIVEIGYRGAVKIWVDGLQVFCRDTPIDFIPRLGEKNYLLPEKFEMELLKGDHTILIKVSIDGWQNSTLLMQSTNMSRYAKKGMEIGCSLKSIAPKVKEANWLVLGTFEGCFSDIFTPEKSLDMFTIYQDGTRELAWNTPRTNLLMESRDGGKFYNWNYHVGSFVWGLQRLSIQCGESKYLDYADKWCNYILDCKEVVKYQTMELHAVRSMNFGLAGRPMLDYISAPAMPFITRAEAPQKYSLKSNEVVEYLTKKQFRINGLFARTYTELPSVWADDMFMGLPFLAHAALKSNNKDERAGLLDDASEQIIGFSSLLQDKQTNLYRQACYPSKREIKVPFWSRGNGWAIWATMEVLEALPKDHKNYTTILNIYRSHIDGIVSHQDSDGYWRNILDMQSSVRESSGTAIFTLALSRGINNGWLERKKYHTPLQKAWSALTTFIDQNGDMTGVKGGTNFSENQMDYEHVPFIKSDTHGLLSLIFAALEMDKYLNKK